MVGLALNSTDFPLNLTEFRYDLCLSLRVTYENSVHLILYTIHIHCAIERVFTMDVQDMVRDQ